MVQPKGFTETFKLYSYQLDAISFMKEIENSPPKSKRVDKNRLITALFLAYEFSVLTPWRLSRLDYVFDLHNEKTIHADELEQHDKIGKLTVGKGGILADEVGLGKTSESTYNQELVTPREFNSLFSSRFGPHQSCAERSARIQ